MNELSPHSLQGMALGLADLDPASRARVQVVPGPAGEALQAASGADVVIADPPRKGLDRGTARVPARTATRALRLRECGLESLLADTARLTAGGRLRLRSLTAFNLMPFTEHVETVGLLRARLSARSGRRLHRHFGVLDDDVVLVAHAEVLVQDHRPVTSTVSPTFGSAPAVVTVRSLVPSAPEPSRTCSQFLPMMLALVLTTLPRR